MDATARLIVAAFGLLCLAVWAWLRSNPTTAAPDDDQGSTPRGLGEDE